MSTTIGKIISSLNGHWKYGVPLVAAVIATFGWYGSYVRASVTEERDQKDRIQFVDEQIDTINTRIDGVAIQVGAVDTAFRAYVTEQRERDATERIKASRTEKMIEKLLKRRRIKVPDPVE